MNSPKPSPPQYPPNPTWHSPSANASDSMPTGGHSIGLNVWSESAQVLLYFDRSGSFDENNQMLKLGRLRLTLSPNPLHNPTTFQQTLNLQTGAIEISASHPDAGAVQIQIWVESNRPVIHAEISSSLPLTLQTQYENWRHHPHSLSEPERMSPFSFANTKPQNIPLTTHPDHFQPSPGQLLWYHRNDNDDLLFDKALIVQHLQPYKSQLSNPQLNFTFGGLLQTRSSSLPKSSEITYAQTPAQAFQFTSDAPATNHHVSISLHAAQAESLERWKQDLLSLANAPSPTLQQARQSTHAYWQNFWARSWIVTFPDDPQNPLFQIGQNYQLFRFQLGANPLGDYPTKFNGGLFTFDPVFVNAKFPFSPDFRRWGGGSFTAQNQRLVYWPLLKSGDFELMLPQFNFYLNALQNAQLRTKVYWNHDGASFAEQLENFGLPTGDNYEYRMGDRPIQPRPGADHGSLLNDWCEHLHDTPFEFVLMILDYQQFTGKDVSRFLPLANSLLEFFDQHYRYQNKLRTGQELDEKNHLVLYPGSAAETYKLATNATSTIAALDETLSRLLQLPDHYASSAQRERWRQIHSRIPPIQFREMNGRKTIAPAKSWARISNNEIPQLYPVFPFHQFGLGKPDLQVAIDTYDHGVDRPEAKRIHGWSQDSIWMARLGLTDRAADMIQQKFAGATLHRFPTFWGPTYDWTPDFNHGGSAMIALQEMLLQTDQQQIRLFPAWPKNWDVNFRLHAPFKTTIEAILKNQKITHLKIDPPERQKDLILPPNWQ